MLMPENNQNYLWVDWSSFRPAANTITSDDIGKAPKPPHLHCPMCWGDEFYHNGTANVCVKCVGIAPSPIVCIPEICGSS